MAQTKDAPAAGGRRRRGGKGKPPVGGNGRASRAGQDKQAQAREADPPARDAGAGQAS